MNIMNITEGLKNVATKTATAAVFPIPLGFQESQSMNQDSGWILTQDIWARCSYH